MRLTNKVLSAAFAAALLMGGLAAPAYASSTDDLTATQPSGSGETARDADVRLTLNALIGTQTPAEIQAILDSGEEVEVLYDQKTQTNLAARFADAPLFSPFVITPRGPGCSTTDSCATGATSNGYYGTGHLNINLSGITKVHSGYMTTTWWLGSTSIFQHPQVTQYFGFPGVHVTAIKRS